MIVRKNNTVHLMGRDISYIMAADDSGDLLHRYFGKKLRDREYSVPTVRNDWCPYSPDDGITLNNCPQEYPTYGHIDLRKPAFSFEKEGGGIARLRLKDIRVTDDVADIVGMPHIMRAEGAARTAHITLVDRAAGLEVRLCYTVFDGYNIVARSASIKNLSDKPIRINDAFSACLELPCGDWDAVFFPGAWARERQREHVGLRRGMCLNIANATGGSGHEMNPFVMIAASGATEDTGDVYSLSLVYSGNHSTVVDCGVRGTVRVMQGINPQTFSWELSPDETFNTPQSILCFSDCGFGGISRELSDLYRANLCRSEWSRRERPILINNWEATYFDFDEEKLVSIAEKAAEAGAELFVMDDGWFGRRDNDRDGLGDWVVNTVKLPSGLCGLAGRINRLGLKFGLWIEPEMVNPASDLYAAHPDWVICTAERDGAQSRNQLILDLSRDDVCDYIIETIGGILSGANIEYVKWDMNRPMTDMPHLGYNHRYILGLYRILDALTTRFGHILFEGCAGGGGRFDAGMLYYFPQIWTSDNSDAIARLRIQYATSMGYPISAMGAHVSAVPNHQTGRVTPLRTRANVALAGVFGYELDITRMNGADFEEIKRQISLAKEIRRLVVNGDFYRLQDPYNGSRCSWEIAAKDGSEIFVTSCKVLSEKNNADAPVKLRGISPEADYVDTITGEVYGGDELMFRGWYPEYGQTDFDSQILHLVRT